MIYIFEKYDIDALKLATRPGEIFGILIFAFTVLGVVTAAITQIYSPVELFGFLAIGVAIAFGITYIVNRSIYKDIKQHVSYIEAGVVDSKSKKLVPVAGSGALYIPVLGRLFPSLWGQKMKKVVRCDLVINNIFYEVNMDDYESIEEGDKVNLIFSSNAKVLLHIFKA